MKGNDNKQKNEGLVLYCCVAAIAGAALYVTRGKLEHFGDFLWIPLAFMLASLVVCSIAYAAAVEFSKKVGEIENALPRRALSVLLVIGFFFGQYYVLRIAIGDNSANVYSQEQLDEARQEAFEQGAAKAVSYVQDYISFEYCRDDWRRLSLGDEEIECEDADDLYSLFDYEAENTNLMYNALEELMKLKGAEIAQWNIELDK